MVKLRGRGLLFDCDGVLVDSLPTHWRAWREMFAPFGVEIEEERIYLEEGRPSLEFARAIAAEYGIRLDDAQLEAMLERKRARYRELNPPKGMRPGALDMLDRLKQAGWKLAMVTGSARANVEETLSPQELGRFEAVLTAGDYRQGKPHPEPYLTACKRLNLTSDDCIVVENAPLGIQSARAAGIRVVAVTSTLGREYLKDANEIIDSLRKLTGVVELIE